MNCKRPDPGSVLSFISLIMLYNEATLAAKDVYMNVRPVSLFG